MVGDHADIVGDVGGAGVGRVSVGSVAVAEVGGVVPGNIAVAHMILVANNHATAVSDHMRRSFLAHKCRLAPPISSVASSRSFLRSQDHRT